MNSFVRLVGLIGLKVIAAVIMGLHVFRSISEDPANKKCMSAGTIPTLQKKAWYDYDLGVGFMHSGSTF